MLFEEHAVSRDLQNVGRPRGRLTLIAKGPALFVFVHEPVAISMADGVEAAVNAEILVAEF
jgi:hypothetical protein